MDTLIRRIQFRKVIETAPPIQNSKWTRILQRRLKQGDLTYAHRLKCYFAHKSPQLKITMMRIEGSEDRLIERLLSFFYIFLAGGFVVFSLGREMHATFRSASYVLAAFLIISLIFYAVISIYKKNYGKGVSSHHRAQILLVVLSIAAGLLTASINRPDIDDSVYAPKAVFYTENPDSLLSNSITWVAGLPQHANSFVFQYYETLQASLAWIFGANFLAIYHVAFPFLVGFLAFCSIYLLIGLFHREVHIKLAGAVFLVMLALLLGETHRAYGNFTIARAFQGKSVLFFLGFYSWTYFSLRYFSEFKIRQVFFLATVGVALTALTTTALIYVPFLSLTLYLSFFASRGTLFSADSLRVGAGYFVALLPTAVLALMFREEALKVMPAGSSINSGFPSNFLGQIHLLVSRDFPISPFLFVLSFFLIVRLSEHRKFFVLWILIPLVLFLNPFVSGFVIRHITTENAYWRMFYLLPFPLIAAVAFCDLLKNTKKFQVTASVTFVILFALIFVSPSSVFRRDNSASFELLSYKIHEPIRSFVENFKQSFSPGTCLAPVEVSSNLVIYTSKFPQYYLREDYLSFIVENYLGKNNAQERVLAANYLYASSAADEAKAAFHRMISQDIPDYVVLSPYSSNTTEASGYLSSAGYHSTNFQDSGYQVWRR